MTTTSRTVQVLLDDRVSACTIESAYAVQSALQVTAAFYSQRGIPCTPLSRWSAGAADDYVYVITPPTVRLRGADVDLDRLADGVYAIDFGEECLATRVPRVRITRDDNPVAAYTRDRDDAAGAVTVEDMLLPLADDLSPAFPLFSRGDVAIVAPAGAESLTDALSDFLSGAADAGHTIVRRTAITTRMLLPALTPISETLRCVLVCLPNASWLRNPAALIETLRGIGAGTVAGVARPVCIAVAVLDGQSLDDAATAVVHNCANVVLFRDAAVRGLDAAVPQVRMSSPWWLENHAATLDVLAQYVGAAERGCPALALGLLARAPNVYVASRIAAAAAAAK